MFLIGLYQVTKVIVYEARKEKQEKEKEEKELRQKASAAHKDMLNGIQHISSVYI
jgi:hypothetical protein